jgi:hypothetical protein
VTRTKQKKDRSNFKAGLSTIIAVLVTFTFILTVIKRNARSVKGSTYRLTFTMQAGVGSLEAGSIITAAGIKVGQIKKVTIIKSELFADIFIEDPYNLFPDALIYRSDSIMGGEATLTIGSFGDATQSELAEGHQINSAPQPPAINGILGETGASRIQTIEKNSAQLSRGMRQITADLKKNTDFIDLNQDFQSIMKQTSADAEAWEPQLQRIQQRIEAFQAQFPDMNRDLGRLTETSKLTEERILKLRTAVGPKQREMIMDAVNEMIEDAKMASARVEEHVIPQIELILSKATQSWDDLESIQGLLKAMAANAKKTLQVAVANSALAAQQLVLAQKEIIGSLGIPLLEKPSVEDQRLGLRIEILDAWARSATRLRRFLDGLEAAEKTFDELKDDVLLERLMDSLKAALLDFEEAQSNLISLDGKPNSTPDEADDQDR